MFSGSGTTKNARNALILQLMFKITAWIIVMSMMVFITSYFKLDAIASILPSMFGSAWFLLLESTVIAILGQWWCNYMTEQWNWSHRHYLRYCTINKWSNRVLMILDAFIVLGLFVMFDISNLI